MASGKLDAEPTMHRQSQDFNALVTVVIATHNRPDTLRAAIHSVRCQTTPRWRLLVVGDGCDGRTAAVVAAFDDQRIRYVDLPEPFGEQSGPNSVGMALADTPFVALLNHDDAFLPDHLALALERLASTGADLYIGQAAVAYAREYSDGVWQPVFNHISPIDPDFEQIFRAVGRELEPCSTWVFRRELVRAVGYWRSAGLLYRPPLHDWLLRAWRRDVRLVTGDRVSVLCIETQHHRPAGCLYKAPSPEHDTVAGWLSTRTADVLRQQLMAQIAARAAEDLRPARWRCPPSLGQRVLARVVLNRATAALFRHTGIDLFGVAALLAGWRRGHLLRRYLRIRTGATLPPPPALERVIEAVQTTCPEPSHLDRNRPGNAPGLLLTGRAPARRRAHAS